MPYTQSENIKYGREWSIIQAGIIMINFKLNKWDAE